MDSSSIIESGKHIVDSALQPRLPEWSSEESLAERVISAMWLYLMTYRLADEEKIDETPVWYVLASNLSSFFLKPVLSAEVCHFDGWFFWQVCHGRVGLSHAPQ